MTPEQRWLAWLVVAVVLALAGLMALAFFFVRTFGAYTDRLDTRTATFERLIDRFEARTGAVIEMNDSTRALRDHTMALIDQFRKHEANPKKEVA